MAHEKTIRSNHSRDVATEFDQWVQAGRGDKMAAGHRFATQQLVDILAILRGRGSAIVPDATVLDAGCGIGWVLNDLLSSRIALGVGIDLSAEMIAIASSRCQLPHISFTTADSTQLSLETNKFSHIISVESLYYTPQPLATLKEWLSLKAD